MTAPPGTASLRVLLRAGDWLMRQRALPRPLQVITLLFVT